MNAYKQLELWAMESPDNWQALFGEDVPFLDFYTAYKDDTWLRAQAPKL